MTFSDEDALKALGSIAWMLYHHARPEMQKLAMNYAEKHNVDGALRLGGSALLKRRETGVERITHSATIGGGKLYKLPAPARHHDVFAVMREAGFTRWGSERTGFYTSDGRYVDRDEAWNIAVAAGQLNDRAPTDGRGGTLYSEDVW